MVTPFITDAQATQKIQEAYNQLLIDIPTGPAGEDGAADGTERYSTLAEVNALSTKSQTVQYVVDGDGDNNGFYTWDGTSATVDFNRLLDNTPIKVLDAVPFYYTNHKNLFDISDVQLDKYVNPSNGLVQTLANAVTSGLIPVIDTETYIISSETNLGLTSFRNITFLAADQTTVLGYSSYSGGSSNSTNCDVEFFLNGYKINALPSGAEFAVFQLKGTAANDYLTAKIQFEQGLTITAYDDRSPFANKENVLSNTEIVSKISSAINEDIKNLYYKEDVQLDTYIRSSDGRILTLANGIVSGFIPIDETQPFVVTSDVDLVLGNFRSITVLGADRVTVLGFGTRNPSTGQMDVTNITGAFYLNGWRIDTFPSGSAFVVFTLRANNTTSSWESAIIQAEQGTNRTQYDDRAPFFSQARGLSLEARDYGRFFLKRYASFGDSITFNDGNSNVGVTRGYQQYIIERCGILDYTNNGVSGETMANYSGSTNDFISDVATYDFSKYDLITIAHGTNDFFLNVPIGTIDSAINTEFYGAYNNVIGEIYTQNPTAIIRLMTPFQRLGTSVNTEGHSLLDYVNAIQKIGEKYGLKVVDVYRNGGINQLTINTYTYDNSLHPNDAGYEIAGSFIANEIKNS